jgi:hypothetical protein
MLGARKITSRKEAVRLVSAVAPREAMTEIITAWQPEQHRDVRVAVVHAARAHLNQPQAWQVLDAAAGDAERAVALAVAQAVPDDLPTAHRPRYARLIGQACRHPDAAVARVAWAAYPRWAPWAPGALDDIADAVGDLSILTTWRDAAGALIRLLDEGFSVGRLQPVFERLMRLDNEGPDAQLDRDRPARQRLQALAQQMIAWAQRQYDRHVDLTPMFGIGEVLSRQQDFLGTGLELMVWAMPVDDGVIDRLETLGALTERRPLAAQTLADAVLARLNRQRDQLPPGLLHDTAATLASRDSVVSGLLALSLVRCAATSPSGWAADRDRAVLRTLRHHRDADVRELALDQYTRAE